MIGRVLFPYLFLSLTGLFFSCLSKNELQPEEYIDKAREMLKLQQFQKAKLYIDSVRIKYPKEFDQIREGLTLMREINFAEQKRTLTFCDSMLKVRQTEFPEAERSFDFEKNAEYETIGHYVYKTQLQDKSLGRTFIQTKVDEKGNLVLTSYYCGKSALHHTTLRASIQSGLYLESLAVPRDGALNYEFNDSGTHYETVRFNRKAENGIANFVLSHENTPITITLIGGKSKTYILSKEDKTAMKAAYNLSVILTDIHRLLNEIRLAQAKMEYIHTKQESPGTSNTKN